MKHIKKIAVVAALVAAASQTSASALTFTDFGGSAPASPYIVSPFTGAKTGSGYTPFNTNSTGGVAQQFTATTATSVTSLTIKGAAFYITTPTNPSTLPSVNFTLKIGTLSGTGIGATFTPIYSDTVFVPSGTINQTSPSTNYADYFQFGLSSPVALTAGGLYAFAISTVTTDTDNTSNYFTLNGTSSGTAYSGGSSITLNSGNTSVTGVAAPDVVFSINGSPVPEPSQWALVPVLGTIAFLAFRRFRSQSVA